MHADLSHVAAFFSSSIAAPLGPTAMQLSMGDHGRWSKHWTREAWGLEESGMDQRPKPSQNLT